MTANTIINIFRMAFSALPAIFWVLYVFYGTDCPEKQIAVYKKISYLVFTLFIFLSLISLFNGLIFMITPQNELIRGPLYNLFILISVFYMLYGAYMILNNNGYYKKRKFLSLLAFVLFPLSGLLIQVIYFGVTLVWNFTTISIVLVYLKMQIKENTIDYLTGLNTRGSFDNYINGRIKKTNSGAGFALIMIDIDHFKNINDKFGHKEGDRALVAFSEVLRKSLRSNDFIARYGGDEFVVLVDLAHEKLISDVIKRIKDELRLLNASKVYKFELDFSYGYSFLKNLDAINMDHFVDHVDELMYKQKRSKCTM